MEKKTPLYEQHIKHNGKIVPFAGFLLPVQYETGIVAEHISVRKAAGLFDVSHMGEFLLEGQVALDNLQKLVTNDCSKMKIGQVKYSPMCNDYGGIVDDLLIYRKAENLYLLVVNAANLQKDEDWISAHLYGNVKFTNASDDYGQIAIQGPNSEKILACLVDSSALPVRYYTFTDNVMVDNINCLISRTGYTGEDGFELYCKSQDTPYLWEKLLNAGVSFDLIPCGLGARDTLRLQASLPLYGHEMNDEITPFESNLGNFVKLDKIDFIGKDALVGKNCPCVCRVGLELIDRGIARGNERVITEKGEDIGIITSGTICPDTKQVVAMAIIDKAYSEVGTSVLIYVRGKKLGAKIVPLPFYKRG